MSTQPVEAALDEHLAAVRKDNLIFAVATVVLTPALLVAAVFFLLVAIAYADLPVIDRWGYWKSYATGMNLFLLFMFISFFLRPKARWQATASDFAWVGAAAAVLFAILVLSYGTDLAKTSPKPFWVAYGVLTLAMFGLLGHAYEPRDTYYVGWFNGVMDNPFTLEDDIDRGHIALGFATGIPRVILDAYAHIFGSLWLIRGLDEGERRAAAEALRALADGRRPAPPPARVVRCLAKAELIRFGKSGAVLTSAGEKVARVP